MERFFVTMAWLVVTIAIVAGCGKKASRIQMTGEEQDMAAIKPGGAVLRTSDGAYRIIPDFYVLNEAAGLNFDRSAATEAQQLAASSQAIIGFSENPAYLSRSFQDMMAHMKGKITEFADDFEVVFGIDYSGSMSDDIEGVISGMTEITQSFKNVKDSNRAVRIAVVTFGQEGKEKVELNLTADFDEVLRTLQRLSDRYDQDSHSDGPGEASYHALDLVANQINWTGTTRFSLFVTDEESKELGSSDPTTQAFVAKVDRDLKANGVMNSVYTIVVK